MRFTRESLFVVVGMLAACGAQASDVRSVGTTSAVASEKSTAAPMPVLPHDRTDVRVTAQAGDGAVWGIGWLDGQSVLRWRGDGWEKIEKAPSEAGNVLELAADPARPSELVSLWSKRSETNGNRVLLQLWRHRKDGPTTLLAEFPNPTEDAAKNHPGETPRLALDTGGNVWLTFPSATYARVAAMGEAPEILTLPVEEFRGVRNKEAKRIGPLAFTADGENSGWLWTVHEERTAWDSGVLFRPRRLIDGRIVPVSLLTGLPVDGSVTMVRTDAQGRVVWALENQGLWRIDPTAGTAVAVDSPPDAWRILDWKEWPDGLAVALVFSRTSRVDRLAGEVWVRSDGQWINAGLSGDDRASTWGPVGWGVKPRTWERHAGGLVGAGFGGGLIAVDFVDGGSTVRPLGWRDGLLVGEARNLYVLPDGRWLAAGRGASVISPENWAREWKRAESNSTAHAFAEHPIRDESGRLWLLRSRGRGAPAVRHWDGGVWHDWPMPAERKWWPEDGLWVDANGRTAVLPEVLDKPAWERDSTAPDGWRRWASGTELVAARADEATPSEAVAALQEGFQHRPVFGREGDALIGSAYGLWHRREKIWTYYSQTALGTAPYRYGFDPDGTPWFVTNNLKRVLGSEGSWVEAGRVQQSENRTHGTEPAPEWLRGALGEREMRSLHCDDGGVWWCMSEGQLWKASAGEAVRVFESGEPSPFAVGTGYDFQEVYSDARGHRLFKGHPYVLLAAVPGPVANVSWTPSNHPTDRFGRVTGAGLVRFEWRLDDGAWRRGEGERLELRELPSGTHVLEVRGYNRKLDAGPVTRETLRIDYDADQRIRHLLSELGSTHDERRAEAVRRLSLSGPQAGRAVEAALAVETDDTRRWWLRAALQAIEDQTRRH